MKKNSPSESAFFNLRVLFGLILALAAISVALFGFGAFSNASAQPNASSAGDKQQFGQTTVIHASRSDLSRPLREQPMIWPPVEADREANPNPKLPMQPQDGPDPVIQNSFWHRIIDTPSIPSPLFSWNGIIYPGVGCNCAPPDTDGEVGKTQYVQMVNEGLQVFDKLSGASLLGPIAISSVWSGFGGACQSGGNGDPIVVYDQLADRWIISQFATPAGATVPQNECIAVSQTGDATGAWYRYDFHLPVTFSTIPSWAFGRTAITWLQTCLTQPVHYS